MKKQSEETQKRRPQKIEDDNERLDSLKRGNQILTVLLIITLAVIWVVKNNAGVTVEVKGDTFSLTGPDKVTISVPVADITAVSLVESFDPGTPGEGATDGDDRCGTWTNDTWGTYTLVLMKGCSAAVVLETRDQGTIVFSYTTDDKTRSVYEQLKDVATTDTTSSRSGGSFLYAKTAFPGTIRLPFGRKR